MFARVFAKGEHHLPIKMHPQCPCVKCCEPLQKLRVRLGTCKIDLSPPVILYYRSFRGDTSVVVLTVLCLGVKIFVLFAPINIFIFLHYEIKALQACMIPRHANLI